MPDNVDAKLSVTPLGPLISPVFLYALTAVLVMLEVLVVVVVVVEVIVELDIVVVSEREPHEDSFELNKIVSTVNEAYNNYFVFR